MKKDLQKDTKGYYARLKAQMSDDERVRNFQRKLYQKAKREKSFRFYVLYDKISLDYVLREAYRRCRIKGGSEGIDGVSFKAIEKSGVCLFLKKIKEELKQKTYRPKSVRRVFIPKSNGKLRPLGIPCIRDRVVQMACKMIIEPIFEADFEDESYGFRPKRKPSNAISKIRKNLKIGQTRIMDADLSSYFDMIPHMELLILIGKRISDRNILHLIKMWLKAPVNEDGKMVGGKKNKRGTPQGGVISPLLANIYLNVLDKAVNRRGGIFKRYGIQIVRYADDFVLMGKTLNSDIEWYLKKLLEKMKLKLNQEKTRILDARHESFDFLGFTVSYHRDLRGKEKKYWNIYPSKSSLKKVRKAIAEKLKTNNHQNKYALVNGLNLILRGWLNYFDIPGVSYPAVAKQKLRWYLSVKLYRFYNRKSQRSCKLRNQGAFNVLVNKYKLINPVKHRPPVNA